MIISALDHKPGLQYGADDAGRPAFPKVRVATVSECASHAVADAAMGAVAGKSAGEQSLARKLYRRLEDDWLLIADRNFINWADWCAAADSGAALLWRVKADLTLPVLDLLADGSCSSVLVSPKVRGKARLVLIEAARARETRTRTRGATSGWSSTRSRPRRRREGPGDRPAHHDQADDGGPGTAGRAGWVSPRNVDTSP